MDLDSIGPVLAAVAFIVGVAAGTYALIHRAISRQTSELWKDEAEALKVRLGTVERGQAECLDREVALQARMGTLETTNKVLADTVTGASAIEALADELRHRDAQHGNDHKVIIEKLDGLLR